jgi:hypothetical protein
VIGDRTVFTVKDKLSYTVAPGAVNVAVVPAWVDVTTLVLSTLVVSVSVLPTSVDEEVAGGGAELGNTVLGAGLDAVADYPLQKTVN